MTEENEILNLNEESTGVPCFSGPAHPDDVVSHPGMTNAEKAALLASWASDARTVEYAPTLRQLDNGAIVKVDEILRALKLVTDKASLNKNASHRRNWGYSPYFARRHQSVVSKARWFRPKQRSDDDDDTPPPCPACVAPSRISGSVRLEPKWA